MSTVLLYLVLLLGLPRQQTPPSAAAAGASASVSSKLDYDFFKTKVQPIFLTKRPGRARCVACHAGSTAPAVFRLEKLSPGEKIWNEDESRKNFEAVTRFVAVPGNLKSLLLIHPLAEDAGGDFFHSGGKQFESQNNPEWQILRQWIMGQTGTAQARNSQ